MQFEFTPAAERALTVAAGWSSSNDSDELGVAQVLLGLLSEPECRAALLLAPLGISFESANKAFAELSPPEPTAIPRAKRFSAEWVASLHTAERLLFEHPRPLILATEHLLLGIAASENRASRWLRQQGLDASWLEAEVHRLSGHQPGPLPFDDAPLAPDSSAEQHDLDQPADERAAPVPGEIPPHEQLSALRVIDAAANRASEALRVVEDYLRFAVDDRHMTTLAKQIRHELTAALHVFGPFERNAARETQSDVGTTVTLATEQTRSDTAAVMRANFKRLEQSLRSLEEFSKTISPQAAATIEQLRYRVYTVERATEMTVAGLDRLAGATLCMLLDGRESASAFETLVKQLITACVSFFQLRDKRLTDRELIARGRLLREMTQELSLQFIMNDRPDLALLAGADGVHLGQDDLSVKDARRILGPDGLIGVSTHSLEQARAAVLDGANYIGVGPTFVSSTKQFSSFTGPELLASVSREIGLPAYAIGGINEINLPQVLAAGFRRVAVSGAVNSANDPTSAARKLIEMLDAASRPRQVDSSA